MASLTRKTMRFVYERDEGVCQLCFSPVGEEDWNIDHIIPRSFGGKNFKTNLRLTHITCNIQRSDDLSNNEKRVLLSEQLDRQHGKCYVCQERLRFGSATKIAPDVRLPVSWTNMALVHRPCRVQYNGTILQEWDKQRKYQKGVCIRKILGIDD